MNYIEIVRDLNMELFEIHGNTENPFSYSSNGFIDVISFNGLVLWSSEEEPRKWITKANDYEPLKVYIRRAYNSLLDEISKMKLNSL